MRPPLVLHLLPAAVRNPWLHDLVRAMDPRRYRVAVATLAPHGSLHEDLAALGIPSFSLDAESRLAIPLALARLRRLARRERVALIHAHLLSCAALAALSGTPWVTTRHEQPGFIDLAPIGRTKRALYRALDRAVQRGARTVVAPSARTAADLARLGVLLSRIRLIPLGFDLARLAAVDAAEVAKTRTELGLEGRFSALAAVRLSWEKDLPTLLAAWTTVCRELPTARLVIAGKGPLDAALRARAADLGLGDRVVFAGFRSDVAVLMAATDAVVHPSLTESTGMIAVEALALARPLVMTRVGVVDELIRDREHCFTVPISDAPALARALLEIERDPARAAAVAASGRDAVNEMFAVERMAGSYADVYDDALGRRAPDEQAASEGQ